MIRIGRTPTGASVWLLVAALAGCGSPGPSTPRPSPTPSPVVGPEPSAATGPCASVMTTTPIAQVPPACAAVWAPYGVTRVPPANLTDSTPVPATVINETGGAVSDADARAWALASNRGSIWYQWAEANVQPSLLAHLTVPSLAPTIELRALADGERVSQPSCAIFPTRSVLFPDSAVGHRYFSGRGESVTDAYVFVGLYPGGCTVTATAADGQVRTIESYPTVGTTFFAGHLLNDPVLGTIWFADGAGNCTDAGAPNEWCKT